MSLKNTLLGRQLNDDHVGHSHNVYLPSIPGSYRSDSVRSEVLQWYLQFQKQPTESNQIGDQLFGRRREIPIIFSEYLTEEAENFRLGSDRDSSSSYDRGNQVNTGVSNDFARCADCGGFSDVNVIRLIQTMHDQPRSAIRKVLTGAYAFYFQEEMRDDDRSDYHGNSFEKIMLQSRKKLQQFLEYLSALEAAVQKHEASLRSHPLLADVEQVIENIRGVRDILSTLQISCISPLTNPKKDTRDSDDYDDQYHRSSREAVFTVQAAQKTANAHGLPNKVHTAHSLNVFDAYVDYVKSTQLNKLVPSLLALGSFIDYAEQVHTVDGNRSGVFPTVEGADDLGLRFSFSGLESPALAWSGNGTDRFGSARDIARSERFGDVALGHCEDGDTETIIVVPGPNMAGKTTFMKAVGYCLHLGRMGRKVPCQTAAMTMPDAIHHNFGLRDDIRHQLSTFKAQLTNTHEFLQSATIQSLGLFDELFNGTSADYQLALAWAFLERCSERQLRVIVSTHCRPLEFFSDPKGYELMRGAFSTPNTPVEWHGARGARTYSIDASHHLQTGTQRDSAAMQIAKEVFADDQEFIVRAEEILQHVRDAK